MAQKIEEQEKGVESPDTDDSLLEGHVHTYFHRTSPMFKGMEKVGAKQDNFKLPPAAQSGSQETFGNEKSIATTEDRTSSIEQSQEQTPHRQSFTQPTSTQQVFSSEKNSQDREKK